MVEGIGRLQRIFLEIYRENQGAKEGEDYLQSPSSEKLQLKPIFQEIQGKFSTSIILFYKFSDSPFNFQENPDFNSVLFIRIFFSKDSPNKINFYENLFQALPMSKLCGKSMKAGATVYYVAS